MRTQSIPLTDKAIARLLLADGGQYKIRDTEQAGFFIQIGKHLKTYMVQGEYWRFGCREFSVQKKIGEFGDLSTREARNKAREILSGIAKGKKPGEHSRPSIGAITVRGAWERYRDAHMIRKGRSERTIENYRDYIERLLGDWLDWPLAKLARQPELVIRRHEDISGENGPYIANSTMKVLRAIYNHALRGNRDLPTFNPVLAVDWNIEHRRNSGLGEDDLGNWFKELFYLKKPLRREFHLLTLLTGSRPMALKTARMDNLDLHKRILHIPHPKGGANKAFDIPLSRPILRCILRVIRLGEMLFPEQSERWLFPADSVSGHMVDHKEDRTILSKWGNDLRQTYRTMAQVAEVSELDVHLLMNHSLRGVNAGYITRDRLVRGHLRKQQERISTAIIGVLDTGSDLGVLDWLSNTHLDFQVYRTKLGLKG